MHDICRPLHFHDMNNRGQWIRESDWIVSFHTGWFGESPFQAKFSYFFFS